MKLLSLKNFFYFIEARFYSGLNLMALLRFAARMYPGNIAIQEERNATTYKALYNKSVVFLDEFYSLYPGSQRKKIAIIGRNHIELVTALFATSSIGAWVYLLNPDMSEPQIVEVCNRFCFDFLLHDKEFSYLAINENPVCKTFCIEKEWEVSGKETKKISYSLPKKRSHLTLLTSGTTGDFKTASHRPAMMKFLIFFSELLGQLHLERFQSVYIATPISHSFGVMSLVLSVALGVKIGILSRFEIGKAASFITTHKIEVIALVPSILAKLLNDNISDLQSLRCIVSGGAPLPPNLVTSVFKTLNTEIYNLYGTSETGFSVLATPDDLRKYPATIGKKMAKVQIAIINVKGEVKKAGEVGSLHIKTPWAMLQGKPEWIDTGDLAFCDVEGYYYLRGRIDEMIVAGGENVYPIVLENILLQHNAVRDAAVIGIFDEVFGQRLKAFVVLSGEVTESELFAWIAVRLARHQQPKFIIFLSELPHNSMGKPDKKALTLLS